MKKSSAIRSDQSFSSIEQHKKANALQIGEPVFVKLKGNDSQWTSGVIVDKLNERSYEVNVNDTTYRRNRHDLKPNHKRVVPVADSDTIPVRILQQTQTADLNENNQTNMQQTTPVQQSNLPINIEHIDAQALQNQEHNEIQLQPNTSAGPGRPKRNTKLPAKYSAYEM